MNILDKQKQLLELAHWLWEDPSTVWHISDVYWDLRDADYNNEANTEALSEMANIICEHVLQN